MQAYFSRMDPWSLAGAVSCLVAVAALSRAIFFAMAIQPEELDFDNEAPAALVSTLEANEQVALSQWRQQLPSWQLMGELDAEALEEAKSEESEVAAGAATENAVDPELLPDSRSGFRLTGVVSAYDDKEGRAVVLSPSGLEREYAVGEALGNNIVLESIHSRSIVIKVNGTVEALRLPQTVDPSISTRASRPVNRASSDTADRRVTPSSPVSAAGKLASTYEND